MASNILAGGLALYFLDDGRRKVDGQELPPDSFFLFLQRFACDAEGRDWTGFEPLIRNFFFTSFTNSIRIFFQSIQGLINLLEEFLFALFNAHGEVLIHFR